MGFSKLLLLVLSLTTLFLRDATAELHYGLRYRESVDRDQDRDSTMLSPPIRPGRVQRKKRRHLHGRRRLDDCVSGGKAGKGGKATSGKATSGKAERRKLDCDDDDRTYPPLTAGKGSSGKGGGSGLQFTDDFTVFDDDTVVEPNVVFTGEDSTPAPSPAGVVGSNDPIDAPPAPPGLDATDDFSNDGLDTTPAPSPGSLPALTPAPSSPTVNFDDLEDISNDGLSQFGDRQGGGGIIPFEEEESEDETISNDPRQSNDPGFLP